MDFRYITISEFSRRSGYTEQAIRNKMNSGVWIEGIHYRRAPDRRPLIDVVEYHKWVEQGVTQGLRLAARA
ncbi:MAG: excisionase [Proteobacteria bacterium]|nr:MAG: excisionase [Pseudomonadota bacterium]